MSWSSCIQESHLTVWRVHLTYIIQWVTSIKTKITWIDGKYRKMQMLSQTASKCHTICSPYKINLPGHMHSRRKQYADINSRCKACKGSEFSNCSAVILSLLETRYWGKHLLNLNAHLHKIPCLGTVKPFKFLLQEQTSH